jgi:hypothetical protein
MKNLTNVYEIHNLLILKKASIYSNVLIKKGQCSTNLQITAKNKELCEFVKRAEKWLKDTTDTTKILKWELKAWVGTPADFGRK